MKFPWRMLYWLVTGAVTGFAFIGLASIGIFVLPVALILIAVGCWRVGRDGSWAAIVGFGLLPGLMLLHDITSAGPSCSATGTSTTLPTSCTTIPPSYSVLALIFTAIAVVGLALGGWVEVRRTQRVGLR